MRGGCEQQDLLSPSEQLLSQELRSKQMVVLDNDRHSKTHLKAMVSDRAAG